MILMMIMFMLILIPMIMLFMNITLSKSSPLYREKMSPFECGFDPLSESRIPFSIQFFNISLIFLIFDVEIALLLPLALMSSTMNKTMILTSTTFISALILSLYLEYLENSLDWKF